MKSSVQRERKWGGRGGRKGGREGEKGGKEEGREHKIKEHKKRKEEVGRE